jgi:hypothetical protein
LHHCILVRAVAHHRQYLIVRTKIRFSEKFIHFGIP